MTKKYYWAIAVAAAFVAGTMTTGTAFAKEQPNGQPFLALWDAIMQLQSDIANIDVNDADSDPSNEIQQISLGSLQTETPTNLRFPDGNLDLPGSVVCPDGFVMVGWKYTEIDDPNIGGISDEILQLEALCKEINLSP